jgi:hypothetical protein
MWLRWGAGWTFTSGFLQLVLLLLVPQTAIRSIAFVSSRSDQATDFVASGIVLLWTLVAVVLSASGAKRLRTYLVEQTGLVADTVLLIASVVFALWVGLDAQFRARNLMDMLAATRRAGTMPDLYAFKAFGWFMLAWALLMGFRLKMFWDALCDRFHVIEGLALDRWPAPPSPSQPGLIAKAERAIELLEKGKPRKSPGEGPAD